MKPYRNTFPKPKYTFDLLHLMYVVYIEARETVVCWLLQ